MASFQLLVCNFVPWGLQTPPCFGCGIGMERNQVSGMLCSMTSSPIHPTLLGNSHHFLFVL